MRVDARQGEDLHGLAGQPGELAAERGRARGLGHDERQHDLRVFGVGVSERAEAVDQLARRRRSCPDDMEASNAG